MAIAPVLAIFTWLRVVPIAETLYLSTHRWNILSKNKPFIGLDNFRELVGDTLFHAALINTSIIAFGVLVITIPTSMAIAALIHYRSASRLSGIFETSVFIPHVVSLVPAAVAWKWIFDARVGPLNALLGLFGVPAQSWLFDPVLAVISIIILCSWQAMGYCVLIYLVGFRNLPVSVHEAAALDGASGIARFRYISAPMLRPITLYVSVVTLISSFNVYAQAFVLASDTQGAPGRQVRVLVLDMLENAFRNYRVGYAATEAVVLLAIVLFLTLVQFGFFRERDAR